MNQASLHRLLANKGVSQSKNPNTGGHFELRLSANLTLIKDLFFSLYPEERHLGHFNELIGLLPALFKNRPEDLKLQDLKRLEEGNWYQSENLVGMQLYVDLFNTDLKGLNQRLDYFKELGVNFLHLMPITTRPKGENDGGYAVNDYLAVDKKFGTSADLKKLTKDLRANGMYLMLDFVVNHTSDEFLWAKKAAKGDAKYQNYYYTYTDRKVPDEFEKTMPQVFPETSPGNFTYNEAMQRWVMTVFNSYQWDLNYSNPEVFMEMMTNLVGMVNQGADIVRLDALAFLWKKIGTASQNLPEAHNLVALFRMCLQVIAPGTAVLAEAIVAPTEIIKYFGEDQKKGNECDLAYNASLMALLWNSIATKKTLLLRKSLWNIPKKPKDATWINYIRCHDDIGLGFDDRYIYEIGWDAKMHRKFLLDYYCQGLSWSPAMGEVFMFNPETGDGRITGSTASLLGLEKAIQKKDKKGIQQAVDKIIMLHSIIISYGGIPMIYAGDEIATLNDYSYLKDQNKKGDSRWVNRPTQDWNTIGKLSLGKGRSPQNKVFNRLKHMIALRKKIPAFGDSNNFLLLNCPNPHIFSYERPSAKGVVIICNFDETQHFISESWLAEIGLEPSLGLKNLVDGKLLEINNLGKVLLEPYAFFWLEKH